MKREQRASGRINVMVSDRAWNQLRDLADIWYPDRKRVDGIVVERVLEEVWQRVMQSPAWNNEAFSKRALELRDQEGNSHE